jgi:hypothetical protein
LIDCLCGHNIDLVPKVDIVQMLIDEALSNRAQEADPLHIIYSLLSINQSSIYGTAFALTNAVFDLFSSPRCEEFVVAIQHEINIVKARYSGNLDRLEALQELQLLDSCIKESLRMGGFNTIAVMRMVRGS